MLSFFVLDCLFTATVYCFIFNVVLDVMFDVFFMNVCKDDFIMYDSYLSYQVYIHTTNFEGTDYTFRIKKN